MLISFWRSHSGCARLIRGVKGTWSLVHWVLSNMDYVFQVCLAVWTCIPVNLLIRRNLQKYHWTFQVERFQLYLDS